MTLNNMVWASADSPNYFDPAKIDTTEYISGDSVCESPAMYTYLYANEKLNIPTDKLRIVSVGSTLASSDNMEANSSLLQWAIRLSGLQGSVKMQTMDYMTEYLMRQQKHVFQKFYLPQTREEYQSVFWLNKRLPTLKYYSSKMIKEN